MCQSYVWILLCKYLIPTSSFSPILYILIGRASIETNFHDLYLKFLDKVNLKPLNKEIVQATYENCKVWIVPTFFIPSKTIGPYTCCLYAFQVLLGSELIKTSAEERSLLKNLGSWLGKITIGRNQVLRAREIDPKSLIIEVTFVLFLFRFLFPGHL